MADNTDAYGDMITWTKSSWSMERACVELGRRGEMIALRNSRSPELVLHFTREEVKAFIRGVQGREFDHLLDDEG